MHLHVCICKYIKYYFLALLDISVLLTVLISVVEYITYHDVVMTDLIIFKDRVQVTNNSSSTESEEPYTSQTLLYGINNVAGKTSAPS